MTQFFEKWKAELPKVAASLTTAALLFAASTVAFRFRDAIWPTKRTDYPLVCIGEGVSGDKPGAMTLEFYVINKTETSFRSESELSDVLKNSVQNPTVISNPRILLEPLRPFSHIQVAADTDFNDKKGMLVVTVIRPDNKVEIQVAEIKARAILRAYITVSGLPTTEPTDRSVKSNLPFDVSGYERTCYQRR